MTQKQELDDTEDKNITLKRELDSKTLQLDKLSFITNDFKEKANIGMLEFLELELKNKENQLASKGFFVTILGMHSRLDEKQKEYASKLEHYQQIFNSQQSRVKELEEENYTLRQKNSDFQQHSSQIDQSVQGEGSESSIKGLNEKLLSLEKELNQERDKNRKLHEDFFKEKGTLMQLEIKLSDLERENVDSKLKVGDLEHKVDEYEAHIAKLEVFLLNYFRFSITRPIFK